MPRAAIYARISSDPTHTELGVTRQLEDCRRLAEQHGLTIVDEYVDDDRSAWSGKARPAYRQMLDAICVGEIDTVVIWHADRLHRHPRELEEYIEVCEPRGVATFACISGRVDLSNPDGRLVARMLGAVAAHESDSRSRRLRRKHQELAEAGKPAGGGDRPFGYRSDRRTVEPTEAGAIREAAARVRAGDSLRSIARDWNDRGIQTVRGGQWTIQVLRRMLIGARLSGQRSYKGEITAKGTWEPILTAEDTAHLRTILLNPARLTRRSVRRYLLAGGLLRCGRCGATLIARPRRDSVRRYVCAKGPGLAGCGRIAIMAEPVEQLICEAVLIRLDTPELAAALAGAAREDAEAEAAQTSVEADRAQLDELASAYGERQITFHEFLAARAPIEARMEAGLRKVSRLTRTAAIAAHVGDGAALRSTWETLPLTRQRAIVAAVLDRAIVHPAVRGRTTFDRERVELVWRL